MTVAGIQEAASRWPNAAGPSGWSARLELGFAWQHGGTALRHRVHVGPLRVQKPFYPEGREVCHVYLLHPPGGLVGGDTLDIAIRLEPGARALITTPAAGKVYRSLAAVSRQTVQATVLANAQLEWLPQETIVYQGAKARLCTRIDLHQGACVAAWDISCLGRPAGDAGFAQGSCRLNLELYQQGRPLVIDRACYEGGSARLSAAWGLANRAACGTFLAHPAGEDALQTARQHCHESGAHTLASASLVNGTLICRAIDVDATLVRERLAATWQAVRPLTLGRAATPPRIWAT